MRLARGRNNIASSRVAALIFVLVPVFSFPMNSRRCKGDITSYNKPLSKRNNYWRKRARGVKWINRLFASISSNNNLLYTFLQGCFYAMHKRNRTSCSLIKFRNGLVGVFQVFFTLTTIHRLFVLFATFI